MDIKVEIEKLQKMYAEDPRQKSFNLLLCGELGSGKTYIFRTCRLPVHVDSFDPGGTKCLKPEIDAGKIVVDSRYESEDPSDPKMFQLWKDKTRWRIREGYFANFGTYCIDSATSWQEAIMNWRLKSEGMAGKPPRFTKDYTPQKAEIRNMIRLLIDLPCDFIITGHLETIRDESSARVIYRWLTTGKGQIILPTLFDEVYVLDPKDSAEGPVYRMLTRSTGTFLARSRLGRGGVLDVHEKPDIKALLKKAGLSTEDKPLFKPTTQGG